MLQKIYLLLTWTIVLTLAEPPLNRHAPYPAAGFRPNKPFNLPGEYLPPRDIEQQQQSPQRVNLQITQEPLHFVGQVQDNELVSKNEPHKAYAPPNGNNDIFLKVQGLPQQGKPQQFVSNQQPDIFNGPQTQINQAATRGPQKSKEQNGYPRPAEEYGTPAIVEPINIQYPDPRSFDNTYEQKQQQQPDDREALDALNTAVEAYNRAAQQTTGNGRDEADYVSQTDADYPSGEARRFTQGQYFVLGPDNTLQRVSFTTSQDEQEVRNNGFTAQLKYTPVGALKDPVFRYNNKGQLVRIVKK